MRRTKSAPLARRYSSPGSHETNLKSFSAFQEISRQRSPVKVTFGSLNRGRNWRTEYDCSRSNPYQACNRKNGHRRIFGNRSAVQLHWLAGHLVHGAIRPRLRIILAHGIYHELCAGPGRERWCLTPTDRIRVKQVKGHQRRRTIPWRSRSSVIRLLQQTRFRLSVLNAGPRPRALLLRVLHGHDALRLDLALRAKTLIICPRR